MKNDWNKLDNAAKIFPSAASGRDTQVFRFSCELCEDIEPELLKRALDKTIKHFPVYNYILKRGFFWYYLEHTDIKPEVKEEYKSPCARIYERDRKTLLYEVTYYKKCINLEVFHVLTDGTGAMHFLKAIVTKYLSYSLGITEPILDYDASFAQKEDDSFRRYYSSEKENRKKGRRRVYQIRGKRLPDSRLKLIRGVVSVRETIRAAHEYGVTMTSFLAACLMLSIGEEMIMRDKKKTVGLVVPVNLRNFFESFSARNFFSLVFADYNFSQNTDDFKTVVTTIDTELKNNLTLDNMTRRLNDLIKLEKNPFARIVPLSLKDICLKIAYQFSILESTASLSNVGIVKMPKELKDYVRGFDVACATSKLQLCVTSYEDRLSLTFTSQFLGTDIQKRFFRKLADFGICAEISANHIDEE